MTKRRLGLGFRWAQSAIMSTGRPTDQTPEIVAEAQTKVTAERQALARELLDKSKSSVIDVTFEKPFDVPMAAGLVIGTSTVPAGGVAEIERVGLLYSEPYGSSDFNFQMLITGSEVPYAINFLQLGVFACGSLTEPIEISPLCLQSGETLQIVARLAAGVVVNWAYSNRVLVRISGTLYFPAKLGV